MTSINIPEFVAVVVSVANGAIVRMGEKKIPWFMPRQINFSSRALFGDTIIRRVRLFGGGTTVLATVVSKDIGQAGWSHDVVWLTIRRQGAEWEFRPGWIRPVLTKSAPRRYSDWDLGFLAEAPTRWDHRGQVVYGWTAREIRAGLHKPAPVLPRRGR